MGTNIKDQAEVEARLWDEIDKHHIGMLGMVSGEPQHFQPMSAFLDRTDNKLWFFIYKDADLAQSAAAGAAEAMFVFQEGRQFYACVGGTLRVQFDRARMDKYWNAHIAAWYPEGKDDPRLSMLCLDTRDAEVWVTEGGPIRYAWEVAKANVTHSTPDVGGHTHLNLH